MMMPSSHCCLWIIYPVLSIVYRLAGIHVKHFEGPFYVEKPMFQHIILALRRYNIRIIVFIADRGSVTRVVRGGNAESAMVDPQ